MITPVIGVYWARRVARCVGLAREPDSSPVWRGAALHHEVLAREAVGARSCSASTSLRRPSTCTTVSTAASRRSMNDVFTSRRCCYILRPGVECTWPGKSAAETFHVTSIEGWRSSGPGLGMGGGQGGTGEGNGRPVRGRFCQAATRGRGTAAAHHPDAADGTAALRFLAAAPPKWRAGAARGGPATARHARSTGRRPTDRPQLPITGRTRAAADHVARPRLLTSGGDGNRAHHRAGRDGEGHVRLPRSGRGSPARGHTLEIKQKDKQFWPEVAAVQGGTTVTFPNFDASFTTYFRRPARTASTSAATDRVISRAPRC